VREGRKTVVNNESPIVHSQEPDRDRPRPVSRHPSVIALVLVLTPVLFVISALVLVWITPLRFANHSVACELRAEYLQSSGMITPLSNPGPSNGFSMTKRCPHTLYAFLRGGPILYTFHYAQGEASLAQSDLQFQATSLPWSPIASVPHNEARAYVESALGSAGIPFVVSGSKGRCGILILDCDRELARKILKVDAQTNNYDIRF
jgi:hypothetical protein